MTALIQLLTGTLGSVGFALIFRLPMRYLPLAAVGGLLNWGTYLALFALTDKLFLSCFVAAALSALYAELLAKYLRAPSTLFLIPAVIPSIPGSNLYYTLEAAVDADLAALGKNALLTCKWAFGIASGISIIGILFVILRNHKKQKNTPQSPAVDTSEE